MEQVEGRSLDHLVPEEGLPLERLLEIALPLADALAAAHLQPADVLVDSMRGRSSTWTRVRVNLEHVPDPLRPEQEALDPDYDPWRGLKLPPGETPRRR